MQLIGYDYARDRPTGGDSLARLAPVIRHARQEATGQGALCLLLDNGDTLQGNPLGLYLARHAIDPHPMIAAMNALGYDAVGLGNHDFDHGIAPLAQMLAQNAAPVVCSNLTTDHLPGLAQHCVLERACPSGGPPLRIGIVSAVPEQTAIWNRHQLDGLVHVAPALKALEAAAARARDAGAVVVIALAHMGIAQWDEGTDPQNQVAEVAALPGVDAVIAGHTHLRFPGDDHADTPGADHTRGLIDGKPVVMPGNGGSDLGVIDLDLIWSEDTARWRVGAAKSALRHPPKDADEDDALVGLAEPAHEATRRELSGSVARLNTPVHSYFTLAKPSSVTALLAAAKRAAIKQIVAGTELAHLPLLAAAASPATGGFDGPENYISLPAGQLQRRHLAGLIPYANHVWAVRATGARIAGWLERSALLFNQLQPGAPDQMLINPHVPGFRYDTIYGLSYIIDLTQPARFDNNGHPVEGATGRISSLMYNSAPVAPEQEFLVAVTDHRAGGGGTFRPFDDVDIVVRGDAPLDQALIAYLHTADTAAGLAERPWRFAPAPGVSALLQTAPDALDHLEDIAEFRAEPCGRTADGFSLLRLHF